MTSEVFEPVKSRNGEETPGTSFGRERPELGAEKLFHPSTTQQHLPLIFFSSPVQQTIRLKMMRSALQASRVASRAAPRSIGAARFFGAKDIKFGVEGRAAMLRGVDLLTDAVQVRVWNSFFLTLKFRFPSESVSELGIFKFGSFEDTFLLVFSSPSNFFFRIVVFRSPF